MDGGSCSNQIAHSHNASEKTRSTCHADLPDIFSTTHRSLGCSGAKCRPDPLNMPSELTFSKKAEETEYTKNVNTVERIRADHTSEEIARD